MIATPAPRQNLKDGDKITVKIPKGTNLNDLPGEAPMSINSTPHKQILAQLLDMVKPVSFRELAELENEDDKLQKKHFLILAVEQVLELADKNQWGLCKRDDFIYLYNGAYWQQLAPEELQTFLGAAAERLGVDRFDARFCDFRKKLHEQFLATAYLPKPEPPKDLVLVNLLNGTLEISPNGATLREFRREDFLTHQLPFGFNPSADAPMFRQYLDRVLPDPESQRILAEYLGYIFIKPSFLKLEKALILYGTGANGKSVMFETVEALLGKDNVTNYSLQSLTDKEGYSRAKIVGKLVNYASEISTDLESSRFKALVSGERIEARLPYGQPFSATDYAKLVFNCNRLPKDVEHLEAYFRRFLIVPFTVTIPDNEQDKQLAGKIAERELPGVLNWVLEGLNRLLEQKAFSECAASKHALERYRRESDSVLTFLDEQDYKAHPNQTKTLDDLYQEYKVFCSNDGYKATGKKVFRERLENAGITVTRRNTGNVVFVAKGDCPF